MINNQTEESIADQNLKHYLRFDGTRSENYINKNEVRYDSNIIEFDSVFGKKRYD